MTLKQEIHQIFEGNAFLRPLFYRYSTALRFELSEGGDALAQFLVAYRKAETICLYIFKHSPHITICLKFYGKASLVSSYSLFKRLAEANIRIPKPREMWAEKDDGTNERMSDNEDYWYHSIIFNLPVTQLRNVLWCALVRDFGNIRPNPGGIIYLFDLPQHIMIWPYDDRGMDVAGPNRALLKKLYERFSDYLLDYDREAMDAIFRTAQ